MDLRDIQRLHAQFSPDMLTIDLPRQIAALPAPANMTVEAVSPAMRQRWTQTGPIVRGSIIAVAVAVLVGMAGMGAATLYRTLGHLPAPASAGVATKSASTSPAATPTATPVAAPVSHADKLREIDATPARPFANAQGLSSSDISGTSALGMTADQFRKSLRPAAVSTQPLVSPPATALLTAESERAAASPIHRNAPRPNVATVVSPTIAPAAIASVAAPTLQTASVASAAMVAPVAKSPEPAVVQQVPLQAVAVSPASANVPLPAVASPPAAPSATGAAAKLTHPARHHVTKPRVDTDSATEPNASARPVTPSVPASRGGSNEVQMF